MLAQVFWAPAKGCSHAVPALFLFSKLGQKRQADPCSSPLGHILRNIKRGGIPWGQYNKPWGTPPVRHTQSSATLNTLTIFLFPSYFYFCLWTPERERPTSPASLEWLWQPQPSTVSQQTFSLYHLHTSSAPPRAVVIFDLLTGLTVIIIHRGWGEYFKQDAYIPIYVCKRRGLPYRGQE